MPNINAIRFEQVTLQFPSASQPAVKNCTIDVAKGQLVVVLGPSGCGKTTLLKMVNRLYEPTEGRIYINDQDIHQQSATALRRQIGYVIQQSGLFPHMTVAQNVAVVPKLLGWSGVKTQARVDELLMLVGLAPKIYRDRYPAQLSGGQQQRVGIARALAGDPDLLLMDEPFGAIDAITRTKLQDELLALQRRLHKTILFVSHDVEEALRLADNILILRAGEVVQYDTPFKILTQPADDFVRQLVDADDMVRQLSLLRVETAMISNTNYSASSNQPAIAQNQNLRAALSLILRTGVHQLTVVDPEQGYPVGVLTLEHIQDSAVNHHS
ncbi:MAG: ABC transporter ATP-binding protein [Thainema sp.]